MAAAIRVSSAGISKEAVAGFNRGGAATRPRLEEEEAVLRPFSSQLDVLCSS